MSNDREILPFPFKNRIALGYARWATQKNQSFQASITRADENEDGKAKPGAVVYLVDVNVKDGVKYLQGV